MSSFAKSTIIGLNNRVHLCNLILHPMRKSLFIAFCFLNIYIKAQFGCSPSTIPGEIFPPNSVNSSTSTVLVQYLCGPNTTLYDTIPTWCRRVYVENNCTLIFSPQCMAIDHIWLKSNSTLTFKNYIGAVIVHLEPGAIINQAISPMYSCQLDTCNAIVYPPVNCTTGLNEHNQLNSFILSPNPSTGEFIINSDNEIKKVEVSNIEGQLLFVELNPEKTNRLNLKNFTPGIYFVKVIYDNDYNVSKKIIIN